MKIVKKILLILFFLVVFVVLNEGGKINQMDQLIQPLLFAVSAVISVYSPKFRKYIIRLSAGLLFIMVITYLFNELEISSWMGSLGFGLLFISVFSYSPQLIKKGYIEGF